MSSTRLLPYTSKIYSSNSIQYWMASVKCSNYRIQFVNQNITNKLYESMLHDSDYPIHTLRVQLKHASSSENLKRLPFLAETSWPSAESVLCVLCSFMLQCSFKDLLSRCVYVQTAVFLLYKNGTVFILCKKG